MEQGEKEESCEGVKNKRFFSLRLSGKKLIRNWQSKTKQKSVAFRNFGKTSFGFFVSGCFTNKDVSLNVGYSPFLKG